MDFAEAYLLTKLGHPELAGWWGKVLGGGGGPIDDGGDLPFDSLTWDQVIASTKTGKYQTFAEGAMKELSLGAEGIVRMQIVGIDEDDLADGSGKAPLSFLSKELLTTKHRINPPKNPASAPFDLGTGTIGGFEYSEIRAYLLDTIMALMPVNVRRSIKPVTKISVTYGTDGVKSANYESTESLWLPSHYEVLKGTLCETVGATYPILSENASQRKKSGVGSSAAESWWTRSAVNQTSFRSIDSSGSRASAAVETELRFPIGFCL